MTVRTALVLGLCLVIAAVLHGGLYAPGHDFVVNRFTGTYAFVPSDEPAEEWDGAVARRFRTEACPALTSSRPTARVSGLHRRR